MEYSNPTPTTPLENAEARLTDVQSRINELLKGGTVDLEAIKILKSERTRIEKEIAREAKATITDEDEREAVAAIKADIRAWLKERPYNYVLANDRYWLDKGTHWLPVSAQTLQRDRPSLGSAIERELLTKVLREDRRFFDECTFSYADVPADTLNMMRRDFATMTDGSPHWVFDTVVKSVAGGKADNITHIEQLILSKYLHPESNVVPTLVFNDGGSTGKSVFVSKILKSIFGRHGVADNLSIDAVTGKHNTQLQGRAVWFINETQHGTYSHNKLKQIAGSETLWIEPKGVNAFEVPMTAWIIVAGNGIDGGVLLEGNGTDRRWSIISGGKPLVEHIADDMDTTQAEALAWFRREGLTILENRTEAGKWLAALYARHGDVNVSEGHHSDDYAAIRQLQRPLHEDIFARIFGDNAFETIRTNELFQAYLDETRDLRRKPMGRAKFHELVRMFLAKHHPDFAGQVTTNITLNGKRSKVDFYSREEKPSKEALMVGGHDLLRLLGIGWTPRAD